ncbi:hypothetical protein FBQ97_11415 [Acidobacteria bacterium ACD]|nr:MAG: hypothetical protein EDX89_09775 [Acidobacteriota bacterium]MDL1950408.1 hypothetical protein [Acidobacteria bacterium ACD]
MRRTTLVAATLVAAVALAWAPAAAADCLQAIKPGATFEFATAAADGMQLVKGTVKVAKVEGAYVEFLVTAGKESMTMPGGIDGSKLIVTNPKNGNVWVATCTPDGLEGVSSMAGKSSKLGLKKTK